MTFQRKTIELPTGPVDYLEGGTGEALLYLHAAGGPMQTPYLQAMTAYRRVIIPIIPGFDGTPKHEGVTTVQDLAELAAMFAAKVIEGPSDVMGASFGGWIALWLAARHPQQVVDLVLEAPAGLGAPTGEGGRPALFAHPEKAAGLAPAPETAAANRAAFLAYADGVAVDSALIGALPTIKTRTLVLMGTLDEITPAAAGWALAANLPHVNVSYIYDAAHALEVDQPEACLRLTRHFLDKGAAFLVASREYA